MTPEAVGPWVFLLLGFGAFVGGVVSAVRGVTKWWLVSLPFIFGVLAVGLGSYGPSFLEAYGEFLKEIRPVLALGESPGPESTEAFLNLVAEGKLKPEYRDVGLAYALSQPVENLGELLDEAIGKAGNAEAQEALQKARRSFSEKQSMESLVALAGTRDPGAYQEFFNRVASDEILPQYEKIGLEYALRQPVEGMDHALSRSMEIASEHPERRAALERTRGELLAEQSPTIRLDDLNPEERRRLMGIVNLEDPRFRRAYVRGTIPR